MSLDHLPERYPTARYAQSGPVVGMSLLGMEPTMDALCLANPYFRCLSRRVDLGLRCIGIVVGNPAVPVDDHPAVRWPRCLHRSPRSAFICSVTSWSSRSSSVLVITIIRVTNRFEKDGCARLWASWIPPGRRKQVMKRTTERVSEMMPNRGRCWHRGYQGGPVETTRVCKRARNLSTRAILRLN